MRSTRKVASHSHPARCTPQRRSVWALRRAAPRAAGAIFLATRATVSLRAVPRQRLVHLGFGLTPEWRVAMFRAAEHGHPQEQCDLFEDLVENDRQVRTAGAGRQPGLV
jgi:phage gp29-like protein